MAQMIQMSEAASIALHSVAYIARKSGETDDLTTAREISSSSGASENHVAKVLQRLVKAGLLESIRGPKGGFLLARPAAEITFLEVYEAIEGSVVQSSCPLHRGTCPFDRCLFGSLLTKVNRDVVDYFRDRKISDFI